MTDRHPPGGPAAPNPGVPAGRPAGHRAGREVETLLEAIDEVRSIADTDLLLRRTVELARDRIGLRRAGIFLVDRSRSLMLGTWGMDLSCAVVDEHHVVYDLCGTDLEALRRSQDGSAPFAVFEGCPIIEHQGGETRVAGRGWVAKTPIRATHATVGILFNDAAMTDDRVDDDKQSLAAILCAVVGTMLDPIRGGLRPGMRSGVSSSQKLVMSTVSMLNKDTGLGGKQIAAALDISLSRLARVFKVLMGMSLVEYRNRLRLERFEALLDRGHTNLLDVALRAGFGSYAQFHRVFRAQLHVTPRDYLHPVTGELRRIRGTRSARTALPNQTSKPAR